MNSTKSQQTADINLNRKHSLIRSTLAHHGIKDVHTALVADLIYGLEDIDKTAANLETYIAANYPDAKGETIFDRVIDSLETMDKELGYASIAKSEQTVHCPIGLDLKNASLICSANYCDVCKKGNTMITPNEVKPCMCGNTYLVIRTDIYKDKREFIYCDCCGAMATRTLWQTAIAQPVQPSAIVQEPVATVDRSHINYIRWGDSLTDLIPDGTKLYTHPQGKP